MSSFKDSLPLPKCLSNSTLLNGKTKPLTSVREISVHQGHAEPKTNEKSNFDMQMTILRRELNSLREMDMSLLSQLRTLDKSIQEFREFLEEENEEDYISSSPSLPVLPPTGDKADMSTSPISLPAPSSPVAGHMFTCCGCFKL